jgi:hypothetical protein
MFKNLTAVPAAAAVLALAACGTTASAKPAAPKISAPAACADFRAWYASLDGKPATLKHVSTLRRAVAESPSGVLYSDMSVLESSVVAAVAARGSSVGDAEALALVSDAYTVAQDCAAVNPGS